MLSEQISLGDVRAIGFSLGQEAIRMLPYAAGEVWDITFTADRPVSVEQFMSLAAEINTENWDVLQFMPIDQTHLRLTVRWRQSGTVMSERDITWDGIKYTARAARAQQASDCNPNTSVWDPATRTCKFKTVSHELSVSVLAFKSGETWQIDFTSDLDVSPQQFFDLVASVEEAWSSLFNLATVISFAPVDQHHFRAIVRWNHDGTVTIGNAQTIGGVSYTITGAHKVATTTNVSTSDTSSYTPEKKLSTGAIVGITLAGAAVVGGGIYLWRAA